MAICIYLVTLGMPPIVITFLGSITFCLITVLYQNGTNLKSYSSLIAVFLVVCILSIVVAILGNYSHTSGFNELEICEDISQLSTDIKIDMQSLMTTVIMLGLLGAVMDTSIAIATSIYEVDQNNKELPLHDLIKSGKSVGRDILGTTVNTLFFAGIGETLMMSVLFSKFGYSFEKIINSKVFFQEFSIIVIANIGCLIIIPITTITISTLLKSENPVAVKIRKLCDCD